MNPIIRKGGMIRLTNDLNGDVIWLAMHLIERITPGVAGTYITMTGRESPIKVTQLADDILCSMEWERMPRK